jgi:hypothetical protein
MNPHYCISMCSMYLWCICFFLYLLTAFQNRFQGQSC